MNPSREQPSDRAFLATVVAITLVTAALHLMGRTLQTFWGVHVYAFYPAFLLAAGTAVLLAVVTLIIARRRTIGETFVRSLDRRRRSMRILALILFVALGTATLWLGRSRHTYLGDGNVLIDNIPKGERFHPREPLTMWLQHYVYQTAAPLFDSNDRRSDWVARDALALGSILAGALFIVVACLLATELLTLRSGVRRDEPVPARLVLLTTLVLLAQGYVQLFFGYVENYTFYALSIGLYLWLALRFVRGASPLFAPAIALVLAMALHLTAIILAPSLLVLVLWGLTDQRRRVGAIRDIVLAAAVFAGLVVLLDKLRPNYDLFHTVAELTGFALTRKDETEPMLSLVHLRDFLNEQALIGPLGLLLFVPATIAAIGVRSVRQASIVFFIVAGVSYLVASFFAGDSNLGYARDWDVWSPGGLVFTAAGLGIFLSIGRGFRTLVPVLGCALAVSLYHTIPWVAINASTERGIARLKTLPLGLGRTETLVGTWYARNGQPHEAKTWYEKAIQVNSANNNAWYLLAMYHTEQGHTDEAIMALENAVRLRPDKMLFREPLIRLYVLTGRHAEALPHLEAALRQNAGSARMWSMYGESLQKVGRTDEAKAAFEKAVPLWQRIVAASPADYQANFGCAHALYSVGRYDDAVPYFQKALAAQPNSMLALTFAGYALRALGRHDEAATYLRKALAVSPNHPDRAQIETWLDEGSPR